MPVVFIPGKGNVQFPDDMTPYQIQLAIEREIIPGRKPETISATKRPEGTFANAWEGIKSTFASSAENQKQMVRERFGTPGSALESTLKGISVLGTAIPSLLQSASTTAQREILDALGVAPPPPPPPPKRPSGPSLGKRVDYALGITSPEREKQEATERARRAAIYGERAVQTPAEMRRQDLAYEAASKQPEFDSLLGEIGYAGAQSLAQMAPGLALSALTRTPVPALGSAFTASSADQYYNVLERGGTKEEAALAANLTGATEVATEMLPTLSILKKFGRAGFGAFLKEYLSKDLPGELVATITQNAIDTAIANPDKTWGQYLSELPRDLVVTAGATLVPGATLATAGKAAQVISNLGREEQPEDEFLAAMQGKGPEEGTQRTAPPSPPPAPPADMGALTKALGPAGGKVTLQEPSGPQEYTFQGFDEDGSVLLEDADGNVLAEEPGAIQQALKVGVAEPEMGVGAVAFGEDITEGVPKVEAPVAETPAEKPKFTLIDDGETLPIDEQLLPQLKQMERSNTPSAMASLEREARQIAADQGATSVSSLHFAQALNNAASRTAGTDVPFAGDWQQAEAPAPARPEPAPESVRTVTTPGGTKVDTAFEVVDAKDLKAATGDLQNRDRSRAATDVQVQDIFSNFDPERLGESLESDRGSPIIGPDNIVESGNGRVMAINKVYDESPERAQAYRDFIEAQGYDTSGVDRPVLVRRRLDNLTPEGRAQFVRESNMDTKLRLSTSEQAGTDAAALTPDVMALMASPDVNQAVNRDFVRGFLSKMPTQEQAAFLDKTGNLSAEGSRRLRTAIKASAYGDADLINTLDESQDNNIKSIGGALEDVAPNWRALRNDVAEGLVREEMDVTEQLVDAAKIVRDVRNRGQKINDFLAQQDAFNPLNPVTERFIRSFYNATGGRAAGRDAIADVLNKYARRAREQTTGEQLFAAEELTPEQILDGISSPEQADLLAADADSNAEVNEVLTSGSPSAMKKAIAKAEKPDDKIMNERANLQKQNRGCD